MDELLFFFIIIMFLKSSGRSCFNFQNFEGFTSFSNIPFDVNAFCDSVRYTAKRLFIGTILNSYFGKPSKLVASLYDHDRESGVINTNKILNYRKYSSDSDFEYSLNDDDTTDINLNFFQPYYSYSEIIAPSSTYFHGLLNQNGVLTTVEQGRDDDTDESPKNFHYDFGLFKNLSSLTFILTLIIEDNKIQQITKLTETNKNWLYSNSKTTAYGNCPFEFDHMLFDYHDEMDILKMYYKSDKINDDDDTITQQIRELNDYDSFETIITSIFKENY